MTELGRVPQHGHRHDPPPVRPAAREAEEPSYTQSDGDLGDAEDPGADAQGGPVDVPEVSEDDRDGATESLGQATPLQVRDDASSPMP